MGLGLRGPPPPPTGPTRVGFLTIGSAAYLLGCGCGAGGGAGGGGGVGAWRGPAPGYGSTVLPILLPTLLRRLGRRYGRFLMTLP